MFKILMIVVCVAIYYFSTITYTTTGGAESHSKAANTWNFVQVDADKDKVTDHFWFNFFVSAGVNAEDKPNKLEFSYIRK